MRFINETQAPKDLRVSWNNHKSSHLYDKPEVERAAKLGMVLNNLARQTSLQFTRERRKVDVWLVTEQVIRPRVFGLERR